MKFTMAKKQLFPVAFLLTAFFITAIPNYSHADLIAYYNFEGNANDVSGNGYDGTVHGATTVTGRSGAGQAYSFDGTNDYIKISLSINPADYPQLTMGAWVKADAANLLSNSNQRHQVLSHDNGGYDRTLGIDYRGHNANNPGPGWSAFSGSGAVLGDFAVNTDAWEFIAVVYDQAAETVMLYVNGATMTESGRLGEGRNYVHIGNNPPGSEHFKGLIDDVFFFSDALTTEALDSIRLNGVQPVPVPSTLLLLGVGLLGLLTKIRQR